MITHGIWATVRGRILYPLRVRTTASGKRVGSLTVEVMTRKPQRVAVALWGDMAEGVETWTPGMEIEASGWLSLSQWVGSDGVGRSGLQLSAEEIQRLG